MVNKPLDLSFAELTMYYRVTLDFTSGKGKNILWFYSLFVTSLLQVKVQNSNDFIAKEKVKRPRSEKVPSLKNLWVKFFDTESGGIEVDIVFKGNLETLRVFFFSLLMLSYCWTWKTSGDL